MVLCIYLIEMFKLQILFSANLRYAKRPGYVLTPWQSKPKEQQQHEELQYGVEAILYRRYSGEVVLGSVKAKRTTGCSEGSQ
jgi:hypothetical protein